MPKYTQTITTNGTNALNATFGGAVLNITRVNVGSGTQGTPISAIALAQEQIHSVAIAGQSVLTNNSFALSIVVNNGTVTVPFPLTEIGIWGTLTPAGGTAGPEQMLLYISDSAPVTVSTSATLQNEYIRVGIASANTSNVTVTITAGIYALEADFISHLNDQTCHPTAFEYTPNLSTASRCGLLPQLNGIQSYHLAGDGTWQPGLPLLNISTTLYVNNSYTQNAAPYFSNLQNAINYLQGYAFAPGIQVTVNIAPGVYPYAGTIYLNHVNGGQITVNGPQNPNVSFTGAAWTGGSGAGGNQVAITGVSSTANIAAGNWVIIWTVGTSNLGSYTLNGTFPVQSVSGNTVYIGVPYHFSPPSITGVSSGWMIPLTAIMQTTAANADGMVIQGAGIGMLRNLMFVNQGTVNNNYAIEGIFNDSPNSSTYDYIGVWGWANNLSESAGFHCSNGATCVLNQCAATNNGTGIICTAGGSAYCTYCAFTHNYAMGVWAQGGTIVWELGVTWFVGNGNVQAVAGASGPGPSPGLFVNSKSLAVAQSNYVNGAKSDGIAYSLYNGGPGMIVYNQSQYIISSANDYLYAQYNGLSGQSVYDVSLNVQSYAVSSGIQGSRLFNIPVNALSSDGSLIA